MGLSDRLSPPSGLDRIGQPWAAEALGRSPLRWAIVLSAGAALAWLTLDHPGITGDAPAGVATTLAWALLMAVAPTLFVVDAKLKVIPNRIVLPLAVVTTLLLLGDLVFGAMARTTALSAVGAGLLLGGYAVTIWLIAPRGGYGWGDVKLTALAGLILGTHSIWLAFVALAIVPPLLAIVPMLVVAARQGSTKASIPFGPFIIAGVVLVTFSQPTIAAMSPLT